MMADLYEVFDRYISEPIRDRGTAVADLSADEQEPVRSVEELARALGYRERWGAIHETREPREGRTLLRLNAIRVPLIEIAERKTYGRLLFARVLVKLGRLGEGDTRLLAEGAFALAVCGLVAGTWLGVGT